MRTNRDTANNMMIEPTCPETNAPTNSGLSGATFQKGRFVAISYAATSNKKPTSRNMKSKNVLLVSHVWIRRQIHATYNTPAVV
jgi:hypothetical protein